jgi:HEAT repeat protein
MNRFIVLCTGLLVLGGLGQPDAFGQKKKDTEITAPKLSEIPGIITQLKDKDAKKRAEAAARLGARGALRARDIKDAIEPLVGMVENDGDAGARRAAAEALGKADPDPKVALEPLMAALKNDKDIPVRTAAATALGNMGEGAKEAVPALQDAVAQAKQAGKTDREKQALGQAAGAALKLIRGAKK